MEAQPNQISIEDFLWVRLQNAQFNFRYKGMPSDVHFTVAFNSKSEDINLHLTKNIQGDPNRKPYIRIAEINKNDFETFMNEDAPKIMLQLILESFDLVKFKNKYGSDIGFISQDKKENYSVIQKLLEEKFKEISRFKRKRRLKN